jgi:hypothetical protein
VVDVVVAVAAVEAAVVAEVIDSKYKHIILGDCSAVPFSYVSLLFFGNQTF